MSKPRPSFAAPGRARAARALACVLLAAALVSCADDARRAPNSEMRADPPAPGARPALAPPATDSDADPLPGAGRRYRVSVERAYFFDQPEQSTPSGRYLRRGDTFYGEGERNGFVKSGFVQPNGVAGVAWLKAPELRVLAAGPTPTRPPERPRVTPTSPPAYRNEAPETDRDPPARSAPAAGLAPTAVVRVARAYFYPSPELAQPRRAYCERGDRVRLGAARGAAVYVTFTNWEKVTTTGWMRQDDLGAPR